MIYRIVEQQQEISAVLAVDRSKWHLMPSDDDFKVLETLVTDALSGEKHVTSSAINPILKHLKEKILKQSESDDAFSTSIKQRILTDISKRYELQNDLPDIATLLDPRFKDRYLENKEDIILQVKEEAITLLSNTTSSPESESSEHNHSVLPFPEKKVKGLAAVLKHIVEETENASTVTMASC